MEGEFHPLDRRDDTDQIIDFFFGCVNPNCSPLIFRALVGQFLTACARPHLLKQFFSNTLGNRILDHASTAMFAEILRCRIAANPSDVFHFAAKFREELAAEAANVGRHHWSRSLVWTSLTERVARLFAPHTRISFEDHEEVLAQFQTYLRLCLEKIWRLLIDFKFPTDVQRFKNKGEHGSVSALQQEILFQGMWKSIVQPAQDAVQCMQLLDKYKTRFATAQAHIAQEQDELRAQGVPVDEFATLEDVETEAHTLVWFAGVQLSMGSMTNFLLFGEMEYIDTCLLALPRMAVNRFTWDARRLFILPTLFVDCQCCKLLQSNDEAAAAAGKSRGFDISGPEISARSVQEAAGLLMQVHSMSNFVQQVRSGYMQQVQQVQQFFSLREECRLSCDVASVYLLLTNAICCDGPHRQNIDLGLTLIEILVDVRNLCQHLKVLASADLASTLLSATFNSLHMLARFPATVQALLFSLAMEAQPDPSVGPDGIVSLEAPYSQELGTLITEVCMFADECLEACARRHAIAADLLQRARSCRQRDTFFSRTVTAHPELVALFAQSRRTGRPGDSVIYQEEEVEQGFTDAAEPGDVTGLFSNIPGLPEQVRFGAGVGAGAGAEELVFHSDFNMYSESKMEHQHPSL